MKRDPQKYQEARVLRTAGKSIRNIAKILHISSSTSSVWTQDIKLSQKQKDNLRKNGQTAEHLKAYSQKRHDDKVLKHQQILKRAAAEIENLSAKELFLTGLALYWAEGFKNIKEGRIGFCNADPRMILFIMQWFKKVFNLSNTDFTLRAEFNIEHQSREEEIKTYWSNLTGIPVAQFNSSYLQKSKMIKVYANRDSYFGVLRIRVKKSSEKVVEIRGWIQGLAQAF